MGKKYIKCPRCELNYILEGEDYCEICKSEMKHHDEGDEDEFLDFDDLDLCPVCGVNYIRPEQSMCEDCKKKKNGEVSDNEEPAETSWKKADEEDDDIISASDDIDEDDEDYNPGFEEISESDDPYNVEDKSEDLMIEDDLDEPIAFGGEDEEDEEIEDDIEIPVDDFETVEVSEDDDFDDDEDDEDYDFGGEDDILGKKS